MQSITRRTTETQLVGLYDNQTTAVGLYTLSLPWLEIYSSSVCTCHVILDPCGSPTEFSELVTHPQ